MRFDPIFVICMFALLCEPYCMDTKKNLPPGHEEVNDHDWELWARPQMDRHFPIKFENGYQCAGFGGCCARCNQSVPNENFRGDVLERSPNMVFLSGICGCRKCKTLTRINFRIYDDARVLLNLNGEWITFHSVPTFSTKVLRLAKQIFSALFWKIS